MTPTCKDCGTEITRMSGSGKCFDCVHKVGSFDVYDAERGSRLLLEGYARYYENHVRRAA